MSCRKNSPGVPCCVPPNCDVACNAYLPDPTWTVTALGKTFSLARHLSHRCFYVGEYCWLDSIVEEASWEHTYDGWDNSLSVPNSCRFDCYDGYGIGLTYDKIDVQFKYRAAVKRFSQLRYSLYISIGPVSPTSNMLQMYVEYKVSKTYWHGASQTGQVRYRISEITCPSTVTTGPWISSAAPTMLSVEVPPNLSPVCMFLTAPPFNGCELTFGATVPPFTWGAFSIGTYRYLNSNANQEPCAVLTNEVFIPDDYAVRFFNNVPPAGGYWHPCSDVGVITISTQVQGACSSRVSKARNYTSASFACDSLPASVVCDSGLSAIAATSLAGSCGANTYTDTFPEIPATITVTL